MMKSWSLAGLKGGKQKEEHTTRLSLWLLFILAKGSDKCRDNRRILIKTNDLSAMVTEYSVQKKTCIATCSIYGRCDTTIQRLSFSKVSSECLWISVRVPEAMQ